MLLTFDDASGLKLADYILGFPPGTSQSWGEVEISAAVESMNIIGSTYVSSIASYLSNHCEQEFQLLPSPPEFGRDYAGALLQSAFLEQVFGDSLALFTQARFELSGTPVNWTFLFIPDADSFQLLAQVLENLEGISELPQ
jgi:chemotaxis protein CheC